MLSVAKGRGHKPAKIANIIPNIEKNENYQFSLERNAYDFGNYYTPSFSADMGNWSAELSVQNLLLSGSNAQAATFLNLSYTYPLYNYFALSAGTMNGTVLTGITIQSFNYASTVFILPEWGVAMSIGPYYANSQISGIVTAQNAGVSDIGLVTGLSYLHNKWLVNASYISGNSNVGGLNMDIGYKMGLITPYIGWGLSTPAPIQNVDDTGIISMEKSPIFYFYSLGLKADF